jgi:hypothetical protein
MPRPDVKLVGGKYNGHDLTVTDFVLENRLAVAIVSDRGAVPQVHLYAPTGPNPKVYTALDIIQLNPN